MKKKGDRRHPRECRPYCVSGLFFRIAPQTRSGTRGWQRSLPEVRSRADMSLMVRIQSSSTARCRLSANGWRHQSWSVASCSRRQSRGRPLLSICRGSGRPAPFRGVRVMPCIGAGVGDGSMPGREPRGRCPGPSSSWRWHGGESGNTCSRPFFVRPSMTKTRASVSPVARSPSPGRAIRLRQTSPRQATPGSALLGSWPPAHEQALPGIDGQARHDTTRSVGLRLIFNC